MSLQTEEKDGFIKIIDPERDIQDMHYYGDKVRAIYIGMSVFMLVMSPFIQNRLPFPTFLTVFGVLFLTMVAGLISPKAKWIVILNFIVSITALIIFGKESMVTYKNSLKDIFFLGNLLLSIASIFAVYYSSKTLRGLLLYKEK